MVYVTEAKQPKQPTELEKCYNELDDTVTGPSGFTTKQRCATIIKALCGISNNTFYTWLHNPDKVRRPIDRFHIALVLNQDCQKLFPRHGNHS